MYIRIAAILCTCIVIFWLAPCAGALSAQSDPPTSISDAKLTGGYVTLSDKVVTGVFQQSGSPTGTIFYVQEPDGTGRDHCGIKIEPQTAVSVAVGDVVTVTGDIVGKPTYPECFIRAQTVQVTSSDTLPRLIGISGKATAGGIFGLQPCLYVKSGVQKVAGTGLAPVGAIVRVWGIVRWSGAENGRTVHYIDDCSGVSCWSYPGLKVVYETETGEPVRGVGTFVMATGVLGAETSAENLPVPVVRVPAGLAEPGTPTVTDDGDITISTTELHASWTAPFGQIAEYRCAIGTTPGASNILGWTSNGTSRDVTAAGLSLSNGTTYYISVKARNSSGVWGQAGSSDGILVDTSKMAIMGDNHNQYPSGLIPMYEKFEVSFNISRNGAVYTDYNPFNPNTTPLTSGYYDKKGMQIDVLLTKPGDSAPSITWPCFYCESYDATFDNKTGACWMMRLAPTMKGTWNYKFRVKMDGKVITTDSASFQCTDALPDNHGFVQVNPVDRRYFRFIDGKPYYPIGSSISGMTGDVVEEPSQAFEKMSAYGGNFSRVFLNFLNLERNCSGTTYMTLNNYQNSCINQTGLARAAIIDKLLEEARSHGIYLEWLLDDWTYIKDANQNPYIRYSTREAPCADYNEFFSSATGREIYKRKIRYWMARWGYSVNLLGLEFVNELDVGGSDKAAWHNVMGDYVHSFTAQPHLVSSSNGSEWLSAGRGIDWASPSIDFVSFHDFAKYTNQWPYFHTDNKLILDEMGIYSLWPDPAKRGSCDDYDYPWIDTAVWTDRIGRAYKQLNWNKPIIWAEMGLIKRDCSSSGFPDWDSAYIADTTAQHFRDAIWAGFFTKMTVSHWKLDYMMGMSPYQIGGEKFWVLGPLTNFIRDEDFAGLTQETAYPVSDPLNESPTVQCFIQGTITPNTKVMAMALRGQNKAYIYVKNLTNTWADIVDQLEPKYNIAPTPELGLSATIKVSGLTPGIYILEKWSTTDLDTSTQLLESTQISVGADGVATFDVTDLGGAVAYKIKQIYGSCR